MIEVRQLTKTYGAIKGIRNLNFSVNKGEILGFLGPNGAGKSTTMNIIAGYKLPSEGTVIINGCDIAENPQEAVKQIGYLPEIPPLYPEMKVKSYLKFISEIKGVARNKRLSHIKDIMEMVGLGQVQNRLIKNLSKGYRQRVGIAQALVSDPEILILDEPTVGLDPRQIADIRTLIKNIGRDRTVILSSHILAEVSAICERVVIINKGEIVATDTTANLAQQLITTGSLFSRIKGPRNEIINKIMGIDGVIGVEEINKDKQSYLKSKDDHCSDFLITTDREADVREELFFKMASGRYPILELKQVGMSLEEIFLQLTDEKPEMGDA